MIPDQEAEGSGPVLSTTLHISLRFLSRLGRVEALTGFGGLVRRILVFFFPLLLLSPLSSLLPRFSTFDRLTPKPCFIAAPRAADDTSFRWRSVRELTRAADEETELESRERLNPELETGASGGGKAPRKTKKRR